MAITESERVSPVRAAQIYLTDKRLCDSAACERIVLAPVGRRDVPETAIDLPFDWNSDPFGDSNWISQLHKWNMVDRYIVNYSKTGIVDFFSTVMKVVLDWNAYFKTAEPASPIVWQDFVVGIRAQKIAFLLGEASGREGLLAPDEVEILQDLARRHLDCIMYRNEIRYTNHTFADLHGVMALAQVVDPGQRPELHDFVRTHFSLLLDTQFDVWGLHREHSFQYQDVGLQWLRRLASSGWFDAFNIKPHIARAEAVREWLQLPDGRLAPVGDTDGARFTGKKTAKAPTSGDSVWNTSGYAIIRKIRDDLADCSYFLVNGAYNGDVHKQSDFLSVLWFDGQDILIDAGKYGYKKDRFRRHVKQTRAHNTVEVDGQSYPLDSIASHGSLISDLSVHAWGYLTTAQAHHLSIGVLHQRFCLYSPGEWLAIVDRLSSEESHDYTQWHQFSPLLKCDTRFPLWRARLLNGRQLTVAHATSSPSKTIHARGQLKPQVQGWVSERYGAMVENDAVGISQRAESCLFATLFGIDAAQLEVAVEGEDTLKVRVESAAGLQTRIDMRTGMEARPELHVQVTADRACGPER